MMTDHEFKQSLSYLGLSLAELAELLAVNTRTTRRWADDPTEIPGPAEQALRAWVRLQRLGLAWRPDGVAIGERSPERIAEQIKVYLRNAVDLDGLIKRVAARGGPSAPWDVRLASRQASLGPVVVSFYPLVNGGFSPASYTRRDRTPDLQRDWTLIEDALACIAKAVSAAGPDWMRGPGEPTLPFGDAALHVPGESARQVLDAGDRLFREALVNLTDVSEAERAAFAAGAQEIGVAIDGTVPEHVANESFLNLALSANPRFHADWPVLIDTRSFHDTRFHPRIKNKGWQTLFVIVGQLPWDMAEFYRLDPKGLFFLRRILDDDSLARANNFAVGAYLDPYHVIARTAEVIAVGLAFAQAMQCDAATRLAFGFRWTKLARRVIHSWTGSGRFLSVREEYMSADDEAEGFVEVPLSTPAGALTPFVERATASLFAQFGGFEVPVGFTSSVIQKLIERA
jgi:hypothetical protein